MSAESEKDYTGVPVSSLPLDEQIKVARSVELSAVVNWGEGGPIYSIEVAETFLLGLPFLDYIKEKYGEIEPSPFSSLDEIASLYHNKIPEHERHNKLKFPIPVSYQREVWFYLKSGTYQVNICTDEAGTILGSSLSYCDGYQGFELYIKNRRTNEETNPGQ